jgi:hypothetical protein
LAGEHSSLWAMLAVRGRGYFNDSDVAEVTKLALRFVCF